MCLRSRGPVAALCLSLSLSGLLSGCQPGNQGGPPEVGPEPRPAPKGAVAQGALNPADDAAALKLFDRALTARLEGDALMYQRLMIELAASYPETRHGARAADRIGGGVGGVVAMMGVLASIAIPSFVRYTDQAREAEVQMREIREMQLKEMQQEVQDD